MKLNSITSKLFVITIAFFVVFMSATLLLQSLFFEKFYTSSRIHKMERELDKLSASYIASGRNVNFIAESIKEFQDSNNAQVAVINKSSMFNFAIIAGQEAGYEDPVRDEILRIAVIRWSKASKSYNQFTNGRYIVYNIVHPVYNTNNIVVICPINDDKDISDAIIAVSSLQPVGEAVSVMNEFYIYIYSGAVLLIIVLSLLYSRMLSKPLVSLNKTAQKMAELDFSTRCQVNSKDEIGSLSNTLNFLSDKLDNTLRELKSANEKLKKDIDRERSLDKMRKEFVAGVSHELKSPISIIEGYAEGLKDNVAEGEERDYYIDVIIDETKRMSEMVTDMLDLSQLDSGNYKLSQREFYFDSLINNIIKKHTNMLAQKKIKLQKNIYGEDISVFADKFRIEQVITNMLVNALRHTENEGIININLKDEGEYMLFEIENQGEHISKEDMEKIWDKFYKADKSRNRDSGGTGLGLAIAKNILTLHESRYGVKNTDLGVLFYFTLKKYEA